MKIFITLLFLLTVSSAASAGIRPSFDPEGCSWRATDIVVVTEGSQIDGNLKVRETWKGDLKPGQMISVPELASFKEQAARLIYSSAWYDKDYDGKPRYVSGERLILFLRDANKRDDDSDDDAKIEERPQYRVETIEFQGETSIPKNQLSRVMSLREGDVFSQKRLDDSIVELNKLGFSLDKDKDVGVSEDHARERVTIKIILDKQGRANASFNRSTMKRSWYP